MQKKQLQDSPRTGCKHPQAGRAAARYRISSFSPGTSSNYLVYLCTRIGLQPNDKNLE